MMARGDGPAMGDSGSAHRGPLRPEIGFLLKRLRVVVAAGADFTYEGSRRQGVRNTMKNQKLVKISLWLTGRSYVYALSPTGWVVKVQ